MNVNYQYQLLNLVSDVFLFFNFNLFIFKPNEIRHDLEEFKIKHEED